VQVHLKVNELITKINGTKITSSRHFSELLAEITDDSFFQMTVTRKNQKDVIVNGRKVWVDVETETGSERKLVLGISVIESHQVNFETASPKFTVTDELQSIGSSGGAMTALAIFETLVGNDFIGDKLVMGTGTIDLLGNIGEIGGVQQKILTAQLYECHIFFVAAANYEEAKAQYDTIENPTYTLVKAATFAEIIAYLKSEGAK
jgi:PDZ domain-containing protein